MSRIILVIALLFFFGCERSEYRHVIKAYENGQVKLVYFYQNENDSSNYRKEAFYPTGKKNYVGTILNNQKHGIWTWWYENGNKKDQCKYVAGFYEDTIFHWNYSGQIKEIEIVKPKTLLDSVNINCNGTFIRYFSNGNPKEQFTWINNIQNDTAKGWYENGQLMIISFWINGIQNGPCKEYYSNGQIKSESFILNGWEDGKVMRWDSLGNIISTEYWKDKQMVSAK